MTATLNLILQNISDDLYRMTGGRGLKDLFRAVRSPSFRHLVYLRTAGGCGRVHPVGLLARLLVAWSRRAYGFQIPVSTKIGGGLYIGHHGCIVINEGATLGRNCNITHNVTIGQTNRGPRRGSPVIGDSVWIGAGAVIVGGIEIGDHVLIAPNAWVNFDVPANSLVVGNPAVVHVKTAEVVRGYVHNSV